MSLITHKVGDATQPTREHGGVAAIIHIVNDLGAWGSGFVIAVSKRWPEPEQHYRAFARGGLKLGTNQVVPVETGLAVVNMVAQKGVSRSRRAVSYDALSDCLEGLYQDEVPLHGFQEVHAPLIGAGLGGGSWGVVEALLVEHATVPTTIWTLP